VKKLQGKHCAIAGIYFGGFQAFMPFIGYCLGSSFRSLVEQIDHWIAFVLLLLIGVNMIRESGGESEELDDSFSVKAMIPLAVATSIDALAVGVTFAFLRVRILPAVCFIGSTTFMLSAAGVQIGNVFGIKYKAKAEFAGGLVLVLMGVKILLEHTGILG